jgi:DedD protein
LKALRSTKREAGVWAFWRRGRRRQSERERAASAALESASEELGLRADPAAQLKVRVRRRLIGAAALLLAVVIVVPMLLDQAPRPLPDNIPIDIPSERTPFSPRLSLPPVDAGAPAAAPAEAGTPAAGGEAPAAPGSAADTAPAPAATPADSATPAKPGGAKPADDSPGRTKKHAQHQAPRTSTAEDAARAADAARARALLEGKTAETAAAGQNRIFVQAAALASETAARELADRLSRAGLAPFLERASTSDGVRFRVRVGPFVSRDEAERARSRLRALGVSSNIVLA